MNTESATDIVATTASILEDGWNTASGERFAEPFADDADFVTIRGERHQGRTAIARGHAAIFASIYRGSRVAYEVLAARRLAGDVVLGHVQGTLNAPTGPLAGTHTAVASLVLVRSGERWQIAAFHNTLVANR